MKLSKLIDIDRGRIEKSKDIEIKVKSHSIILTEPDSAFLRFLRRLIFRPKIVNRIIVFQATNTVNGNKYSIVIQFKPQSSYEKFLNSEVKIYCSCSDFMFRSAYILNKDKSLFRNRAIDVRLDQAIDIKPTRVPGGTTNTCKHIVATVNYMKNNWEELDLFFK